jgi:hypothetical protein
MSEVLSYYEWLKSTHPVFQTLFRALQSVCPKPYAEELAKAKAAEEATVRRGGDENRGGGVETRVPELLKADERLLCAAEALFQLAHTAQLYLGRVLELLARQVQGLALGTLSVEEELSRLSAVLRSAAERVVGEARAVGRCLEA